MHKEKTGKPQLVLDDTSKKRMLDRENAFKISQTLTFHKGPKCPFLPFIVLLYLSHLASERLFSPEAMKSLT